MDDRKTSVLFTGETEIFVFFTISRTSLRLQTCDPSPYDLRTHSPGCRAVRE